MTTLLGRGIAAALASQCRATVDGFAGKRGLDDAVAATVLYDGRSQGRFIVAMPRALMPALFGAALPGVGSAEAELGTALGALATAACTQVLRALHDTAYGFQLAEPWLAPADAASPGDGEVVVRVGGSWLAVNLIEA